MPSIISLWLVSVFFLFGSLGINYFFAKKLAKKSWGLKVDKNYRPKVSIVVPTFNEKEVIEYKLKNLSKVKYPKDLIQIVFVDSGSSDSTVYSIKKFAQTYSSMMDIKIVEENERKGKSSALNVALKSCDGEVIVTSDADCFWPPNILLNAIPFLADPSVGAISGPKKLLNSTASWITRNEHMYLESMNLIKLGESKISSTMLFEGGFSAFKKEALGMFDPYNTGSDDCGTVIDILRKGYRTIMIPEAEFYTLFPKTLKEKLQIKIRRSNQLLRVLKNYAVFLFNGKIKVGKGVIVKNLILYLIAPIIFFIFVVSTICIFINYPHTAFLLVPLFIPKVRIYATEMFISYTALAFAVLLSIFRKKSLVWKSLRNETFITKDMLEQKNLI